jgi:hypothetical protein
MLITINICLNRVDDLKENTREYTTDGTKRAWRRCGRG